MVKRVLLKQDDFNDLSALALPVFFKERQKVYTPAEEARIIENIEFPRVKEMQKNILHKDNCFIFRMR